MFCRNKKAAPCFIKYTNFESELKTDADDLMYVLRCAKDWNEKHLVHQSRLAGVVQAIPAPQARSIFSVPLVVYDVMQSTVSGRFCKIAHRLYLVNLKITGGI